MTTYPLATHACTVTSTGIFSPAYTDILASLQASYTGIYGADTYLGNDSMDGQFLAILAQAIYDGNQADVAVYNSFSPATATGTGLSSVVKINGLQRLAPSNSSVPVLITGTVGTIIANGIITDNFQNNWALPSTVTIPVAGSITVTATAQVAGAITALAQTFAIATPVAGWQSAVSSVAATPGAPTETDSALRQRQSNSTALPALSVVGGIYAAIANITGVQRLYVYENDTGSPDVNGLPAHSIAVVVQGGSAQTIAQTIELKKTPGTYTYGTTTATVYDAAGLPVMINFFVLSLITMSVRMVATALTGYVSTTGTTVQSVIASYLSTLSIGQDSYLNKLWGPANLYGDDATTTAGQSQSALDTLSNTYNVKSIYQARSNMVTTTSVYSGGATSMNMASTSNYAVGQTINFLLSSGNYLTAVLTGVTGSAISFTPAIPSGSTVAIGTLVYVAGDVVLAFNEGAYATSSNVIFTAS